MPHINELTASQQEQLNSPGFARITPRVKLTADMLPATGSNPDGSPVFGTPFQRVELDVSCGVLNREIVVNSQIAHLPTSGKPTNQLGNLRLRLCNTVEYIGAFQDGSALDYVNLTEAEVAITAECGGMVPALPIYRGKAVSQPEEVEGATTFDFRPTIWEIIDVELRNERNPGAGSFNPIYKYDDGTVFNPGTDQFINQPAIDGSITHYHGIAVFDEFGNIRVALENENPDRVQVNEINFQTGPNGDPPVLGKYVLEFTGFDAFKLTQPDERTYYGEAGRDFSGGYVNIPGFDLLGTVAPGLDVLDVNGGEGARIEFWCYYTAVANPISLVKNLLLKAYRPDTWGLPFFRDNDLPIDWDTMEILENYFADKRVYVSETNRSNSVFSPQSTEKPIRIRDICQKILDHVGCQLRFDSQGRISINSSWYLMPGQSFQTWESCHLSSGESRSASHRIFSGGPRYDYMRIRYGYNHFTENFAATRAFTDTVKVRYAGIFEAALLYYKSGRNDADVAAMQYFVWEVVKRADVNLELSFSPNFGLAVEPGDKFRADFSSQPRLPNVQMGLGEYWQIYKVSKSVGGIVKATAHPLGEIIEPGAICNFIICEDKIC